MNLLKEIVRKQGINFEGKTIYREAVRGIIIKNRKLLMIYSSLNGDYKFPGGGVNPGDIDDAISTNRYILNCSKKEIPRWTARETYILELLKQEFF